MSHIPLLYSQRAQAWFTRLSRARSLLAKIRAWCALRPQELLNPVVGLRLGLTDPVCGLDMGRTAENLAREFLIDRASQDAYALCSHQRACAAQAAGVLKDEIAPLPLPPAYATTLDADDGPRPQQSLTALAKLGPAFERGTGTVTAGNACPLTDGAAAVLVMSADEAQRRGLQPLGYLRGWAYAGCDGARMGLGPVYASAKLCARTGLNWDDFERIELNEAFAAQALACARAVTDDDFARRELGRDHALGHWDENRVNVNGGAIAIGHPVGATGTRLLLTLLHELRRSGSRLGLATLCVGGGQGAAVAVECDPASEVHHE
jgi:acetyl-CoA C-acetyltransferase/acetyl-CoA acyltransferase